LLLLSLLLLLWHPDLCGANLCLLILRTTLHIVLAALAG